MVDKIAVVELMKMISNSEPRLKKDRLYWYELYRDCHDVIDNQVDRLIETETQKKQRNANNKERQE